MYSSFLQDINNVYHFKGLLGSYNCVTCTNQLEIEINDFQSSLPGASVQINSSLIPGYYSYYVPGGSPTEINVQFNSSAVGGTVQSYLWDFGDGTTSISANPLHLYSHPGIYNVCLLVTFTNSSTSSICYPVKFEVPEAGCKFLFNETPAGLNTVQFNSSYFSGTGPFQYNWDFGDGNSSTSSDPLYTYSSPGIYKVCLTVIDANNKKSEYCRNVQTPGFGASIANFIVSSNTNNPNPMAFSNVIVKWTDANGITYTSENASGQSTGFFKIISVENYSVNENGQTTKKVKASIKCILYDGTNTIQLDNAEIVFAFSYP